MDMLVCGHSVPAPLIVGIPNFVERGKVMHGDLLYCDQIVVIIVLNHLYILASSEDDVYFKVGSIRMILTYSSIWTIKSSESPCPAHPRTPAIKITSSKQLLQF